MGTGPMRKFVGVAWQRRGIEMATAGTTLVPSLPYQSSISSLNIRRRYRRVRGVLRAREFGNSVREMDKEKRLVGVMDFVRLYFL